MLNILDDENVPSLIVIKLKYRIILVVTMLIKPKINIFMYSSFNFLKQMGKNQSRIQPPHIFSIVAILFGATGRSDQTVRRPIESNSCGQKIRC